MSRAADYAVAVLPFDDRSVATVRGPQIGHIVGIRADGWLVDYPGNPHGALLARTTLPLDAGALRRAADARAEALLVFEGERSERPIVIGLLSPRPSGTPVSGQAADVMAPTDARIDGRRVVLEAQDEIVLRCGETSITLRRNGRIVIRGAYVETSSKGVNRIKGGSVQIN